MKKLVSVVLSVFMILSSVIVASALSYNGFSYRTTLSYDEMIITGYTGTDKEITVPSEINGIPVAIINQEAFMYNKTITSVKIPASVKSIGNKAFMYCSNLSKIDFNNANATVGNNAFYGCTNLLTVSNADGLTKIDSSAFNGTAWLNNQSDGVVYIGKVLYTFKGTMSANASITVKNGTVSISPDAFANQTKLAKISFPTTLKNIGYRAFCGCTSLKSVTLLSHIETIETTAFGFTELKTGTAISYVPIDGFKIYTEENSAAQKYAELGNVPYEIVGPQKVLVESLKLNASSITWEVGKSGSFKPTVLPENADNKTLSWTSSNTSVATVSAEGKLTAVAPGSATITCKTTDGSNLTATCKVTVTGVAEPVVITKIKFNKSSEKISAGKTYTINPTITPADATNKKLVWESSDTSILKVDADGKITGVSSGFATLTCRTTDGSNRKATCRIVVNPATPQKVVATKSSDNSVKVTWSAAESAMGYYVYRATSEDGFYTRVGKSKTTDFTDNGAKSGKTYYYKIVSYDFASILLFKSTKSAPAKVTI